MRVLLTGVGGFIGTHCLEHFLDNTDWFIIGLDSWRHKGDYCRLNDVIGKEKLEKYSDRYILYKHDLSTPFSQQLINLLHEKQIDSDGNIVEKPIDIIINVASDSAVERSNTNPDFCWKNNTELIFDILEFARKCQPRLFIQCSTDEVYGNAQKNQSHVEWDKVVPNNPYSASKAAQEALCIAYWRTFDLPIVITNSINNYGEGQDPEKFIPKIIQYIYIGQKMPIYGNSHDDIGSRFYLHAKDHADVFVFLSKIKPNMYNNGENSLPDRYNIGSDIELNNLQVAQKIAAIMNKPLLYYFIPHQQARKGYDTRYSLDISKLKNLGWKPPINFESGLHDVVMWTLKHNNWSVA